MKRNLKIFLFSALFLLLFTNCGGDEPNNGGLKRQNGYLVYNEFLISVSGNEATIEKYNGNGSSVTIPSTIQDYVDDVPITYTVKKIAPRVFYECSDLRTVSIASTVESIGDYAFGRTAIKEVSLPTANLGKQVFYETSLKTLHIGGNAPKIPNKFMYECIGAYSLSSLTKLTFSEGIKEIGVEAFHDCTHLQDIDIPNSVTTIKDSAFKNIISLKNIIFGSNLQLIDNHAFNGCSYLKTCRFKGLTPPTINGGSTLAYYPVHTVIYVPQASLQAYKNALNGYIAFNCTITGY